MSAAQTERGATLILTVIIIVIVAAIVMAGTGDLQSLDEISRAEFAAEAQAYSVAQAGLVDAYAWFRRQATQPVTAFAPQLDLAADPAINETEDPATGLVRTFEICPGLWGRYTVMHGVASEPFTDSNQDGIYEEGEPFTDTNGDGKRTPAKGTRDVTAERGLPGAGTVWRIECLGQVFRRSRADLALGDGPNHIVGSALLATEIQRLPLSPPISGAAYCSRGDDIVLHNRARIRAPVTALCYPEYTGYPSVSSDSEIDGAYTAAPVAGDRLFDVFGANLTDLQAMADISTKDGETLPDELPPYSLVVVDGDLYLDNTESLRGSGVLVVTGDLTVESGSHSYYTGFVYVGGALSLAAPSFVRGQVMARGNLMLEGGTGDFVELEHDPELMDIILAKMGNYRYARAFFRPLPNHADGRPNVTFESRAGGQTLTITYTEGVGFDTDYQAHATEYPNLVAALDKMNQLVAADPELKRVASAFRSAENALDKLLADPPEGVAASTQIDNAIGFLEQSVDQEGLSVAGAQEIIDLLQAVPIP